MKIETMQLKFIQFPIVFLLLHTCLSAQVLMPTAGDGDNKMLLNGIWKFKYFTSSEIGADSLFYMPTFDDSNWSNIQTPGNWELQGFSELTYGREAKEATGLYRTNFSTPKAWDGNPIYICFDGVSFGYTLWVNGKYAGEYASSYNRQTFDITTLISQGKSNTLAVKVITRPKGWEFDTNDDWSLTGIFRDVTLFSLPMVHIKDLVVKTFVHRNEATLNVNTLVEKSFGKGNLNKYKISACLLDPSGNLIKEFSFTKGSKSLLSDTVYFSQSVAITNPLLWTAETPHLYKLKISLKEKNTVKQLYVERVGIREVTWDDGVLCLNGTPIKLRGINHPDISPVNGRCISEKEMLQDLKLMHEANINFIRIAHYPPHPRLLELCDSLGFYVMNEVPYGFGDQHLNDTTYLPILMQRAKATVWRGKNRPCIIAWSVGNENPMTEIGLKTGRYVKRLDDTRPYCFPQYPSEFEKMIQAIPDSLDVLDDHYATALDIERYITTIDRPLIVGEYAHSLGLDFNSMQAVFETMYAHPKLAGGAVWSFMDQGILRKSSKKISKNDYTLYVWPTSDTFYDTGGNQGADGVVYSNRVPQVDYWQVRKVYSPVKALDDMLYYKSVNQSCNIRLVNRYDFTNLSEVNCKWQLYADRQILDSGTVPLNCMPHDTITLKLNVVLPDKPTAAFYYIKLLFEDKMDYQFYEKTYPIQVSESYSMLAHFKDGSVTRPTKMGNTIFGDNYQFEFSNDSGSFQLINKDGNILITEGPYARTGRKPSISQIAAINKKNNEKHMISNQFLWTKAEADVKTEEDQELAIDYRYLPDTSNQSYISGEVAYHFADNGCIEVSYRFIPQGIEEALETGISFLIPSELTEFRWVGKGPYAAYPGKDRLSEFGIYHLNSNDLYYAGNRQAVDCAVFSDTIGNGLALIADKANVSVERTNGGIMVSHNSHVSGRFNKYKWPDDLLSFQDNMAIVGSFAIIPLSTEWPNTLKDLFGDFKKSAIPFQPFYHSYDQ